MGAVGKCDKLVLKYLKRTKRFKTLEEFSIKAFIDHFEEGFDMFKSLKSTPNQVAENFIKNLNRFIK